MNYEVFDALNAGTLCRAEDETEQAFMERVYRMLCEEEGAACGLIGLMKPSFLSCSAENPVAHARLCRRRLDAQLEADASWRHARVDARQHHGPSRTLLLQNEPAFHGEPSQSITCVRFCREST